VGGVKRTLVALLALLLIATPAHAQTGKLLLDMTIQTAPGIPSGHCLPASAGRLIVEARLTGETRASVRFSLGPAADASRILDLQVKTVEPVTGTAPVQDGVYCYTLVNEAMAGGQDAPGQASPQDQPIVVRLIWLPMS
jgi:hypothetical protein